MGKKNNEKEAKTIDQLEKEQYQEDDSEIHDDEMSINSQDEQFNDEPEVEGEEDNEEEGEGEEGYEGESYEEDMEFDENEELDGNCDEEDDGQEKLLTDKEQIQKNILNKQSGADQAIINMKIHEITKILCKFKELRDPSRSRQSYLDEVQEYLCQYYSYNKELMELFQQMFNPNELIQFLEANEQQRVLTIRTNTLKTRRKELAQVLIQRGVNLDPLAEWSKVGIKIYDSKVPVGATPEYLAGHYMLQSASSFLPVIALAPQMHERVLDMAAAPGGKTSYIAQLMRNTGTLFANDIKADRLKGLFYNIQRLGINNTVVCNYDGRKFPKVMTNFDRVLLDAPCTGLGIIARDHSIKANKLMIDIYKHAHLQRELLLSAIDCCKKGGYIVYSTCSIAPQENEAVVNYAMKNRHIKICETGCEVGEEGLTKFLDKRYHPELKKSRRIYPHTHNMDGFYLCKIKKIDNGPRFVKEKVEDLDELEEQLESRPKKNRSKQISKKEIKRLEAIKEKINIIKGIAKPKKDEDKKSKPAKKALKKQKQKQNQQQKLVEKSENTTEAKEEKSEQKQERKVSTDKKQERKASTDKKQERKASADKTQKSGNKQQNEKKQQQVKKQDGENQEEKKEEPKIKQLKTTSFMKKEGKNRKQNFNKGKQNNKKVKKN